MTTWYVEKLSGETVQVEAATAAEAWAQLGGMAVYVEPWETAQAGPAWQASFQWAGWADMVITSRSMAALGRMINDFYEDVREIKITKLQAEGGRNHAAV